MPAAVLFIGFMGALTLSWLLLGIAVWRSRLFTWWQLTAFSLAGLAVLLSHSVYSAVVLAAAAVVIAPTIAGRSSAIDRRVPELVAP